MEIYISTDVETNGKLPGPNSMLSIGAAAFHGDTYKLLGSFSANLELYSRILRSREAGNPIDL